LESGHNQKYKNQTGRGGEKFKVKRRSLISNAKAVNPVIEKRKMKEKGRDD